MISVSQGLKNSLIILEHLRNNEELNKLCDISVGAFTNCREVGLTFILTGVNDDSGNYLRGDIHTGASVVFTYCIYEHRNSDSIIINGKEGYVTNNGELPYAGETKYDYLAEFPYNGHIEAADKLAEFMLMRRQDFCNKLSEPKMPEPVKLYEIETGVKLKRGSKVNLKSKSK
jgi:hypothetical protein